MRFSRSHTSHGLVVSMLMRIIEDFQGSRLQLLRDLCFVRHSARTTVCRSSINTFCLMASSIGVIEEFMVENGLLVADVMTRRNIRL
jgi:hypothetical protein